MIDPRYEAVSTGHILMAELSYPEPPRDGREPSKPRAASAMPSEHHDRGVVLRVIEIPARAIVVLYLVLDSLVFPLFRPIARWIAARGLIVALQQRIAALPAYAVLFLLALPFVGAEPAKIYGVYLLTEDHLIGGLLVLAAAYFVSIVVVERIFDAGRTNLLTIPWFAMMWSWFTAIRDRLTTWVQSTKFWASFIAMKVRMRATLSTRFRRRPAE
ncbi:MAG: hypothetical protein NVSMB26_12140 [Beijerinckiaceae bacterium]